MAAKRMDTARRGERDAERFLKRRGYRIIAKNFTCPMGELDVVALRDGVLTFVEVRSSAAGDARPEESVDHRKQRQLSRLAGYFVKVNRMWRHACQFDVIAVNYDQGTPRISHFPDAFEAV